MSNTLLAERDEQIVKTFIFQEFTASDVESANECCEYYGLVVFNGFINRY